MNLTTLISRTFLSIMVLATTSCTVFDRKQPTQPIEEKWSFETYMQTARQEFAAVELGGAIYAIAGNTSAWEPTSSVERYFLESIWPWSSFEFVEPLPISKGLRNHAAVAYGGKIYVFGGQLTDIDVPNPEISDESITNRIFVYNPQKNRWSEGSPMREKRANHAAVVRGDKIFIIGGNNGKQKGEPGFEGKGIEVYSPATNRWVSCYNQAQHREEECTSLPEYMGETRAALVGDNIYVMDAWAGQTVWIYMPFTNHWGRHGDAPHIVRNEKLFRSGYSVTAVNNQIYAVGRTKPPGYTPPSNQSLNVDTRSWTNRLNMSTWSNNLAVINHGVNIYALGGSQGGTTVLSVVNAYQPGNE